MKGFIKFIFSVFLFVLGIAAIAFVMLVGKTYVTDKESRQITVLEAASQVKDSLEFVKTDMDSKKASQIADFVKEKANDGSLKSMDGVKAAIKEGADELNLSISDETASQVVDALGSLERMGFSTEELAIKTSDLYTRYGSEFMDHMEEAFVEAAKDAAGNTAENIWHSVEETVENLF